MSKFGIYTSSRAAVLVATLVAGEASAQSEVPPIAYRDPALATVSSIFVVLGASSVMATPRVDWQPGRTWRPRWHASVLAPAMSLLIATALVEIPIKSSIESVRPGCTLEDTIVSAPGSGCETFGGPSIHAFAAFGTTGAGLGIFLVDALKHSGGGFNFVSFAGNVLVPTTSAVLVSVMRGMDLDESDIQDGNGNRITVDILPLEFDGQIFVGALAGFFTGATLGLAYAALQEPSCGLSGALFCW